MATVTGDVDIYDVPGGGGTVIGVLAAGRKVAAGLSGRPMVQRDGCLAGPDGLGVGRVPRFLIATATRPSTVWWTTGEEDCA